MSPVIHPANRSLLRRRRWSWAAAGALVVWCWCAPFAQAGVYDTVIAVVNDDVITQRDIDLLVFPSIVSGADTPEPSAEQLQQARLATLRRLINERLLVQAAKAAGLEVPAKEVQAKLQAARERLGSRAEYERALVESGVSERDLRQRYREQGLIQRVLDEQVRSKIAVTPAEVQAYYEQHDREYNRPEEVRARHMLIRATAPGERAHAKRDAERVHNMLLKGGDFAEIARQRSDGPHAAAGGELGWVQRGQMLPEIDAELFSLEPGQLSPVIESGLGYHMVLVEERRGKVERPFETVADEIRLQLLEARFQRRLAEYLDTLRRKAYIVVKGAVPSQ